MAEQAERWIQDAKDVTAAIQDYNPAVRYKSKTTCEEERREKKKDELDTHIYTQVLTNDSVFGSSGGEKIPAELVEYYAKKQGLSIEDPQVYVRVLSCSIWVSLSIFLEKKKKRVQAFS